MIEIIICDDCGLSYDLNWHNDCPVCKKQARIKELEDENREMREALKFYADRTNWVVDVEKFQDTVILSDWDTSHVGFETGGKRARKCLEEI